jgi:hypothetical protein
VCVVEYNCFVELLRIEQCRLELCVRLYIEIVLVEKILAVGVKLNARGNPSCREFPVIPEAGVANFRRIVFIWLDQSHEQQAILLNPELLGFQIPFCRTNNIYILPIPFFFMNLRQIDPLALHLVDRGLWVLAIHVKSQHEQHVNVGTCPQILALLKPRQSAIDKNEAVPLAGRSSINAQLSRQLQSFIPNLCGAAPVRIERYRFLLEDDRVVPRVLVTVVHRRQQRLAVADFLGPCWHRSGQTSDQTNQTHD